MGLLDSSEREIITFHLVADRQTDRQTYLKFQAGAFDTLNCAAFKIYIIFAHTVVFVTQNVAPCSAHRTKQNSVVQVRVRWVGQSALMGRRTIAEGSLKLKLYMFRTVSLSIISSFSLYTQQYYM